MQFLISPFQSFYAYFSTKWRDDFTQTKVLYTTVFSTAKKQKGFQLKKDGSNYILKRNSTEKVRKRLYAARKFPSFSRTNYKHSLSWVGSPVGFKLDLRIIILFHVFDEAFLISFTAHICQLLQVISRPVSIFFKWQPKFLDNNLIPRQKIFWKALSILRSKTNCLNIANFSGFRTHLSKKTVKVRQRAIEAQEAS